MNAEQLPEASKEKNAKVEESETNEGAKNEDQQGGEEEITENIDNNEDVSSLIFIVLSSSRPRDSIQLYTYFM